VCTSVYCRQGEGIDFCLLRILCDLFDRKIACCENHEAFDSQQARESALQKLVTKRASRMNAALAMASHGIERDPKYLPRSFKAADLAAEETA
jgi:hypothetical protein